MAAGGRAHKEGRRNTIPPKHDAREMPMKDGHPIMYKKAGPMSGGNQGQERHFPKKKGY